MHIIDGEKVSIRYPGQAKTCNKCHQKSPACPGKGLAKDCTAEKILLSEYMLTYWTAIKFKPETTEMNEVDIDENEKAENVIETKDQVKGIKKVSPDNTMMGRYGGVVIKGFKKETLIDEIVEVLKEAGLPFDYGKEDIQTVEKAGNLTLYVNDLKPEACVELVNNLHREDKLGNRISVFTLVEDTPTKALGDCLEKLIEEETEENVDVPTDPIAEVANDEVANALVANAPTAPPTPITPIDTSSPRTGLFQNIVSDLSTRFWNNYVEEDDDDDDTSDEEELNQLREQFKRKAEASPENNALDNFEKILSKKEKKKLKKSLNKSK